MTDYALTLIMRSEARKRAAEERDIGDDPWSAEEYFKRDSECGNTSGNDFIKGEIQYKGTSTSVAELNELTASALKAERLLIPLKTAEESCRRKREELRRLQAKYEALKEKISGSGESVKQHTNETNEGENQMSSLLVDDHETEGRVSGCDRAGLEIKEENHEAR